MTIYCEIKRKYAIDITLSTTLPIDNIKYIVCMSLIYDSNTSNSQAKSSATYATQNTNQVTGGMNSVLSNIATTGYVTTGYITNGNVNIGSHKISEILIEEIINYVEEQMKDIIFYNIKSRYDKKEIYFYTPTSEKYDRIYSILVAAKLKFI